MDCLRRKPQENVEELQEFKNGISVCDKVLV